MERPRVLLADDNLPLLEHEVSLLQPSFEVVGTVNDGEQLLIEAKRLRPDVIVLDITMPNMSEIEAARELRETGLNARLVFLTVHEQSAFVRACFAEGGFGYVTKSRMVTDLIPAIKEALCDHYFVSPSVLHQSTPQNRWPI